MTDDLRRRVVDAMLAVDVANGGKADMYMLADAALSVAAARFAIIAEEEAAEPLWRGGRQTARRIAAAIRALAPARATEDEAP